MRNTRQPAHNLPILGLLLLLLASGVSAGEDAQHESELLAKALTVSPEYTRPVTARDGEPLTVFHDLNGDDALDVVILTIAFDPRIEPTLDALSDTTRLYAEDSVEPVFILETYFAGQEAITTVEIGHRIVLADYGLIRLTTEAFPVAMTLTFRNRSGTETDLIVFHDRGRVSRFGYEDTRNRRGSLIDLDEDGSLDVVTAVRVPEAGRGYETFIELWEIGRDGFSRTASLPVVRTVNDFLLATAADMEAGAWSLVADRVRPRSDLEQESPLLTDSAALESVFRATGHDDERDEEHDGEGENEAPGVFDYPAEGADLARVTFPRLADNPFPSPYLGRSFRLVFRVECCDGDPRFFEATVALAENPFLDNPLAFLTHGESRK
ncbi:MAG: hypothetical protein ACOC7V_09085 [Spirochaetota bacterium]